MALKECEGGGWMVISTTHGLIDGYYARRELAEGVAEMLAETWPDDGILVAKAYARTGNTRLARDRHFGSRRPWDDR